MSVLLSSLSGMEHLSKSKGGRARCETRRFVSISKREGRMSSIIWPSGNPGPITCQCYILNVHVSSLYLASSHTSSYCSNPHARYHTHTTQTTQTYTHPNTIKTHLQTQPHQITTCKTIFTILLISRFNSHPPRFSSHDSSYVSGLDRAY